MKYPKNNFNMISNDVYDMDIQGNAAALLLKLKVLESRLCNPKKDTFTRSDQQLADCLNWSISTVQRAKKELENLGVIETFTMCKKGSHERITAYHILV